MNDIINKQLEQTENLAKELWIKLYPKQYINLSLKEWSKISFYPEDFIVFAKEMWWCYSTTDTDIEISKIPQIYWYLISFLKANFNVVGPNGSQYIDDEEILRKKISIEMYSIKHIQSIEPSNKVNCIDYNNHEENIKIEMIKKIISWNPKSTINIQSKIDTIAIVKNWYSLQIKKNAKVATIPWFNFNILDTVKKQVITHDQSQLNIIEFDDNLWYKILQTENLSIFGELKYATMDNNKNFFICIFETDNPNNNEEKISQLKIFQFDHGVDLNDPNSLSCLIEQETISDIQEILYVDDNNDIIILDTDYQVRRLQTNMQEFPVWFIGKVKFSKEGVKVRKVVNKTLEDATALLVKGIKINTEDLETKEEDVDIAKLRQQIWDMPFEDFNNKTLKQLFDSSETVEDLLKVKSIIEAIKRTPEIAAVHGLLDPIESAVFKKYNQAKLDELYVRLDRLANSIGAGDDFNTLIYIQSSLKEIHKDRAQIVNIAPTAKDKEIKELSQIVNQKIDEYRESHQDDIQEKIDTNLNAIKEYLDGINYINQITSVYITDIRKNTENMIEYLDSEGKKKNKEAMKHLVKARQNQLNKNILDIQKHKQAEEQVKVDDIKDQIGQMKQIIASLYEEDALKDMEKNDPLVLSIRSAIDEIMSNKALELAVQVESAFKERLLTIKYSKETTKKWIKSLDKYGIPTSLYFVPEIHKKVKRELMGKQVGEKIKIYFETNTGTKIEPDINKKILGNFPFQVTHEEFIKIKQNITERRSNGKKKEFQHLIAQENELREKLWEKAQNNAAYKKVKENIKKLDETYYIPRMLEVMTSISWWLRDLHSRPRIPHLSGKTVIGPSIQKFIGEMWRLLDQQMTYKEGFIIVESEAGTGKNFKMDILAHLTHRELFHISCNQSMEKEDLLFSPELNSEWSFKQKSELIRWLQTPGSIILLDEINTLRPGIAKLLNPLLAGQRYINDPQLGKIYSDPSVLIVGLMNPRYYLWTSDIAQEFLDRARIVNDDYPEEMEEWFIVSKYVDGPVSQMTLEEFENFRNKYIVQWEVPNDKKIYNIFIVISKVMKVARKIRMVYSKTMKWEADLDNELKFIFSIRAGNFIMQDFNNSKDIKKSMGDVIMPKITDSAQKKIAQSIIDEICG